MIRSTLDGMTIALQRFALDERGMVAAMWWTVTGIHDEAGEVARLDRDQSLAVVRLADLRADGVPDDDPAVVELEERLGWR